MSRGLRLAAWLASSPTLDLGAVMMFDAVDELAQDLEQLDGGLIGEAWQQQ